jgi:hypothetical protein
VRIAIEACGDIDHGEVERIAAVELGALLARDADDADTTRATATCTDGHARLQVDDPITGKSLLRAIDLQTTAPAARPRLLALALAELVVASWTELELEAEPTVVPGVPLAITEARRHARIVVEQRATAVNDPTLGWRRATVLKRAPLRLIASAVFTHLPSAAPLWGGRLALEQLLGYHLGWTLDVTADHGDAQRSLGTVSIETVSLGAALLAHHEWSRFGLEVGPGLRLGVAMLQGKASQPDRTRSGSVIGVWSGPLAMLGFTVAVTSRVLVGVRGECGYALASVGGQTGTSEVAIDRLWLGAHLGAGIAW